ncbi:Tn7-like element transposition protein TnsE [Bacillus sp. 2205SS5-2]|uniref:Tn7-like element transposition protein TnsE n=1 Tax=Bacillus sp. 2205SS5-2 TaxID=3109031 RepID=UPI0030046F1B
MSKQQVKIAWPFAKGKKAQLLWIGEPFRFDHKIMIKAYFRSQGRTEGILMDWGTLPSLAIQHFYTDGIITASQAPEGVQEIDMTVYPNKVKYYERPWSIHGSSDPATSRSFVFSFNRKNVFLPVIEVLRSILAPNGFLLYRLFESNSFPQFFTETYEPNKIHLSFSSQYELKYTKTAFVYQLVWLLTNHDIRQVYENLAFRWLQEKALKFEWAFTQPITITARVKKKNNTYTILQIVNMKNKDIPYQNISISHPEIQNQEKSKEAKKYTYRSLNKQGVEEDFILDEQIDGSTEDFDLVQMNQLKHEYTSVPRIERIRGSLSKQRTMEDENTKAYFINQDSIRSTADSGGQQLVRGLEHQMLHEIQAQGELQDFINVLKVLEQYPIIGTIQVIMDVLPDGYGERKFTKLSDNITRRRYIIAQIYLGNGKQYNIVEIERENRSLSTLILSSLVTREWKVIYDRLLVNLVNNSGTWTSKSLKSLEGQGITLLKAKHSSKGVQHRAEVLLNKLIY